MELEKILQELDRLFANYQVDKVEYFLKQQIDKAQREQEDDIAVALMNELIGHFRETGESDKSLEACAEVLRLMKQMGLEGGVAYATTLLNIANAYRAAGKLEESMVQYRTVQMLYERLLEPHDMCFASLYNNLSLLYQEMGDFDSACICLEKALDIVKLYEDARIETAVTYTNLAASKLRVGRYKEAMMNLKRAFSIFEMDEPRDYHYSGALSAMGEAQYLAGNLEESARYYEAAMREIKKNMGESKAYAITKQNYNAVMEQMEHRPSVVKQFYKGMELCEAFYQEYGVPMIQNQFPGYEKHIAVGLVGEGSECFGFDDEISRDHDFGPGFCLWLTDQTYEKIGEALQKAYDELPTTYMGVTRRDSGKAQKRVGVFRIGDFYERLTGLPDVPITENQWLFVEDYQLAAATNGKVFRDDFGEFSRIRRELLKHYPEEVRVKKIARKAALMAQSGQYNYARMYGRGEKVTAQIALAEFMKHTMSMVYLLNHVYAPFYKWTHKGMEKLPVLPAIRDILSALADMAIGDERIPQTIEIIVQLIIQEMKKQSLTFGEDNYLDHHTEKILKSISQKEKQDEGVKSALVNELIQLEWRNFDKVDNMGKRADCQDDWNTFSIMRKSQYYTWTMPMLQSYINDFKAAEKRGWNLISEKYGRMMESTDPVGYAHIRDRLPILLPAKRQIIEEIVKIQVAWMEDFAKRYPKAAGNARSIHTAEDSLSNTSYETYLRGELGTYSDTTLDLYGRFIAKLLQNGENLAQMTMANTAFLYGYQSLEELEAKL